MAEWVLVPRAKLLALAYHTGVAGRLEWADALAAKPIPRPVWDAMVERGARAICEELGGDPDGRTFNGSPRWTMYLARSSSTLRAALNNPEGDEENPLAEMARIAREYDLP